MPNGLKYLISIAADLKPDEVPFQPWAAALYKERRENQGRDDPNNKCLPSGVPEKDAVTSPFKIMQFPGEMVILYESRTIFREIFTDGRPLPKDPESDLAGIFNRALGRRRFRGGDERAERQNLDGYQRPSAHRSCCISPNASAATTTATWIFRSLSRPANVATSGRQGTPEKRRPDDVVGGRP